MRVGFLDEINPTARLGFIIFNISSSSRSSGSTFRTATCSRLSEEYGRVVRDIDAPYLLRMELRFLNRSIRRQDLLYNRLQWFLPSRGH